ncbi:MAG: lysylphosphatidylglycerol synthase transmembrane domain-containing protein [Peptostreptococcaceae bacterium]
MKKYKDVLWKILKNGGLFIILIVLTFYFVFKDMDISTIFKTISSVNINYILIAIGSMCIFILCEAMNIKRNLISLGYKTNILKCINYSANGFFFSSITPSASGGQPMQVYYMCKDNIKFSHSTMVLFIGLIFFQTVAIIFSIIGFLSQYELLKNSVNSIKILFMIGLFLNTIALIFLLFVIFSSKKVIKLLNITMKVLKKIGVSQVDTIRVKVYSVIEEYNGCASFMVKNKQLIVKTFFTSCIQIFALHSIPYWVYRSFGFNEYSIFVFVGVQAVLFITVCALPLPGAVGASEGGFLILFKLLFPVQVLSEAMLLSRGISSYFFIILTGIYLIIMKLKLKRNLA